jgi:osmoprotectant transport system permease protein
MNDAWALLPEYGLAHLQLVVVALSIGIAISVPAGIWLARNERFEGPVMAIASAVQTIPGLALLALMVPLLATLGPSLGIAGIGRPPALIALALYSLLPILRNTVAGIRGVAPSLVEAAQGVGMTPREQLLRVELPLALPVIVAGIRTATVWTVGTATLATPVGATSLGNFIFGGLQTRQFGVVVLGSAAAAALALSLDGLVRAVESGLVRRSRRRLVSALTLLGLLYAGVAGSLWMELAPAWGAPRASVGQGGRPIVIGAKPFSEQYILSSAIAEQIERETGAETRVLESLGSTVAFDALRAGDIDVYVDYSGTLWAAVLGREPVGDRARVLREVSETLAREYGVLQLGALGFENAYAFAVRGADAEAKGWRRLSDLVATAPALRLAADVEFFSRAEWTSVQALYAIAFAELRSMDASLMYGAIEAGEVDVIVAYSSDGRIGALDLRVLEDDLAAIPPYDAVLLVPAGLAERAPAVIAALRQLVGAFDADTMRALNYRVASGRESASAVGREFARSLPRQREPSAP